MLYHNGIELSVHNSTTVYERVNARAQLEVAFRMESTAHISLLSVHYCIGLVCAVCELE